MCVTPGSECALSSSTPSNAPSPSRAGCGFHISAQPAPGAPGPGPAGGAPARDGPADAEAEVDGRADAEPPTPAFAGSPPDVVPAGPAAAARLSAGAVPKRWTARTDTVTSAASTTARAA